jgi:uncharacterized MAPEG superfamily protein
LPKSDFEIRACVSSLLYYGTPADAVALNQDTIMTIELTYLAAAALLTLLIRVAWMLNKVQIRGLGVVVGYPKESKPLSEWGHRLWVAHEDAIQSLVTFAVLVIIVQLSRVADQTTAIAAAVYFWARLLHVFAYMFALRWVKTIAFLSGFFSQLWLVWILFS